MPEAGLKPIAHQYEFVDSMHEVHPCVVLYRVPIHFTFGTIFGILAFVFDIQGMKNIAKNKNQNIPT